MANDEVHRRQGAFSLAEFHPRRYSRRCEAHGSRHDAPCGGRSKPRTAAAWQQKRRACLPAVTWLIPWHVLIVCKLSCLLCIAKFHLALESSWNAMAASLGLAAALLVAAFAGIRPTFDTHSTMRMLPVASGGRARPRPGAGWMLCADGASHTQA